MPTTVDEINRVALLTPPGMAAIAVIRFSGPGVANFCQRRLSRRPKKNRCVHVELRSNEDVIDDPVAVLVDDQTLDLSVHGGRWVIEATLQLAAQDGFTITPWHGVPMPEAVDDIEAEMLLALPAATTREALSLLLAQPTAWRAMLVSRDQAAMHRAAADRCLQTLLRTPRVAIIGAPNVGKSTLANQLFGRDHSIVADMPGTTRDWVGERANIDGLEVLLIDTPGRRLSDDAIEQSAIAHSRPVVESADCVVLVLDPTQSTAGQECLRDEADLVVMNKADLGEVSNVDLRLCARTGEGIDLLRRFIARHLGCDDLTPGIARCWTDAQRDRLKAIL